MKSPVKSPVEPVWLTLRERFLSLRVFDDTDAIIDAWNAITAKSERF